VSLINKIYSFAVYISRVFKLFIQTYKTYLGTYSIEYHYLIQRTTLTAIFF